MALSADDRASVMTLYAKSEESETFLKPEPKPITVSRGKEEQLLRPFTVVCIILNQTIGAGIFVVPVIVLQSTHSVGISLLLWTAGAIVSACGLFVWLEWAMSIPKYKVPATSEDGAQDTGQTSLQCVPRSGGEKNYLEYAYGKSFPRTTCIYGILFITLGNLSGNAIQFGIYILQATHGIKKEDEDDHHAARAIAIACMTISCLLHGAWRKGGIVLMNILTVLKVVFLMVVIVSGFTAAAGVKFPHYNTNGKVLDATPKASVSNFDTHQTFANPGKNFADYSNSILSILFTFNGYQQPFYTLSEVYRPKKYFVKSTAISMAIIVLLFILVNVAYLCVIPSDLYMKTNSDSDMARMFFGALFGHVISDKLISAFLAASIFGNIITTTFTAARVKQEIAAEGILPYSLIFARSYETPYSRLKKGTRDHTLPEIAPERTPAGALLLHWAFAVLLIGCSSATDSSTSSILLTSLYRYSTILIVGFFVSAGLVFLHFKDSSFYERFLGSRGDWRSGAGLKIWGGSAAAIIYASVTAFLIASTWVPPTSESPFGRKTLGFSWYVVPSTCFGVLLLGFCYYLWFGVIFPSLRGKTMVVDRKPTLVKSHGEWIQIAEILQPAWVVVLGPFNFGRR